MSHSRVFLSLLLLLAAVATWGRVSRAEPPWPDDPVMADWLLQDFGADGSVENQDAKAMADAIRNALAEIDTDARPLLDELAKLVNDAPRKADPRWLALYAQACERRRAMRLGPLLGAASSLVFVKHHGLGGSHYAYTEGLSDAQNERHFRPGAALCVLDLDGSRPIVRVLLDDPNGVIRDPDVSYDGERILFAWKKSLDEDDYHLYEMTTESGEVRQLTSGLGHADYEGVYLPNGDIIFNSSRCVQIVDCWWTEVSNLYTCDGNGRYLRRLSFDQVHTNYPTVLDDGRVIYTRWDYNDRGQIFPQPLFQMNPDGTAQTEFYGNNSWFPTTLLHARGVPGTQKVLAVVTGHHNRQRGKLGLIDTAKGRQEASGVQLIAPVRPTEPARIDAYGQSGDQFRYPYPVTEREFLVTYAPQGENPGSDNTPYGLYFMDIDGRRELLAWDAVLSCNRAVPLAPRAKPHARPSLVNYRKTMGNYYVEDVYVGPGLEGIPRGAIKALRVVALEFRSVGIGMNNNGGPAGGALVSTPIAVGRGAWDVKRLLGEAKVHPDGSAFFTVPARTPVYFQALDEKRHAVQTMRSWSTLQPGETFSCVGCHEDKDATPPGNKPTAALRGGPKPLEPFYGPARGFSFIREIQPILDRNCIRCHDDRDKHPAVAALREHNRAKRAGAGYPVSPRQSEWRFTTDDPGAGWEQPGFDDGAWGSGHAGFGRYGTPGGQVNATWHTPDIYVRRAFEFPESLSDALLAFDVCHDEDVEIYINGVLAASAVGYKPHFETMQISPEARAALRPGKNLLAAHCHQTTGGQLIDVALVAPEVAPTPPTQEKPPQGEAFSLLGTQTEEGLAKRAWSDAYLALTNAVVVERSGDLMSLGEPNARVSWISAQSVPEMLPPYHAGAAKSGLIEMLEDGHNDVELTQEELDKIACWIDLLVPYCGDYTEANTWSRAEKEKYEHFTEKRRKMEEEERGNIQAFLESDGR